MNDIMKIEDYKELFFAELSGRKSKGERFKAINSLFVHAFIEDADFRQDLNDLAELQQLRDRMAVIMSCLQHEDDQ